MPIPRPVLDHLKHLKVVRDPETGDVGEDKVRSVRHGMRQADGGQGVAEDLPLLDVALAIRLEEALAAVLRLERGGDGLLQRRGRAERDARRRRHDGRDEPLRTDRPPDPPARRGERLAGRADGDRPLPHAGQRREPDVLGRRIRQAVVHLVGDHEQVVLLGERGDLAQLVGVEDLA